MKEIIPYTLSKGIRIVGKKIGKFDTVILDNREMMDKKEKPKKLKFFGSAQQK